MSPGPATSTASVSNQQTKRQIKKLADARSTVRQMLDAHHEETRTRAIFRDAQQTLQTALSVSMKRCCTQEDESSCQFLPVLAHRFHACTPLPVCASRPCPFHVYGALFQQSNGPLDKSLDAAERAGARNAADLTL